MAKQHLENLRHGAAVRSSGGDDLGKLYAVVLDPRDNELTHLVVNAGPHFPEPGFGAPRLIEVPAEELEHADEKQVTLRCTKEKFKKMPEYSETSFFTAAREGEEAPDEGGPAQRLWNAGLAVGASIARLLTGIAVPAETFRKARFERHILNDAPLWRVEPHEQIGEIERVLVDEETDEIEALVIKGGLLQHEVVLPIEHVTEIQDGVVRVRITDEELARLRPFRPE